MIASSPVLLGRTASRPVSSLFDSSPEDLCCDKRREGFRSEASVSTAFHSEAEPISDASDSEKEEEDVALVAARAAREAFLAKRKRIAQRHSGFQV